jgi:hypothetical protein
MPHTVVRFVGSWVGCQVLPPCFPLSDCIQLLSCVLGPCKCDTTTRIVRVVCVGAPARPANSSLHAGVTAPVGNGKRGTRLPEYIHIEH